MGHTHTGVSNGMQHSQTLYVCLKLHVGVWSCSIYYVKMSQNIQVPESYVGGSNCVLVYQTVCRCLRSDEAKMDEVDKAHSKK
jgi:hypothetical protein